MLTITYRMEYRGEGRKGTAVLYWPRSGRWHLVPSESNRYGGRNYDWDKVLPESYPTQKAALAARKQLRAEGKLP
jgi:hypothetical protein